MKKLLSMLALVLATSVRSADLAQWCADYEAASPRQGNERLAAISARADRLLFTNMHGPPSARRTHEIADASRVRALLVALRCVRPDITWKESEKGGFVGVVPTCRCGGDFQCTVFEGDTVLAAFLLRHKRCLESEAIVEKSRMVMESPGIEALYAALEEVTKQG
jgi:hypothetical protein